MAQAPVHHHAPAQHRHAGASRVEHAVARAINRIRDRHGLHRLHMSRRLSGVAAWHSFDLLAHGLLSHASSDGTSFDRRIRHAVPARSVGETLIEFRGNCSGGRIVRYWMHSPPHRAEILSPGFRRLGVGRGTFRGTSVVTADFASGR
jgi:uncharacterized protein YkwD